MESVEDILNAHGKQLVEKLQAALQTGKGTGRLQQSVKAVVSGGRLQITAAAHWPYATGGRKPGKQPPVQAIQQWIEAKGIVPQGISKKSLAYLVARKIGMLGTKPAPEVQSEQQQATAQQVALLKQQLHTHFIQQQTAAIKAALSAK